MILRKFVQKHKLPTLRRPFHSCAPAVFPGFVQAAGYAKPEQMKIPLVYFEEGDQSVEAQDAVTTRFHSQGPSVLNAWASDLITVHTLGLFHPAFYSMSYRNQSIWQTELPNLQVADYDYEDCLLSSFG